MKVFILAALSLLSLSSQASSFRIPPPIAGGMYSGGFEFKQGARILKKSGRLLLDYLEQNPQQHPQINRQELLLNLNTRVQITEGAISSTESTFSDLNTFEIFVNSRSFVQLSDSDQILEGFARYLEFSIKDQIRAETYAREIYSELSKL